MSEIEMCKIHSSEYCQAEETNIHSREFKRYQTSVKYYMFCVQLVVVCGVIGFAVYNISINRGNPTTWSTLLQSSLEHILARPPQAQSLINSTKEG